MATSLVDTRGQVRPDPKGACSNRYSHLPFSSNKSLIFESIRYGPVTTMRHLLKEMPNLAQITDNRGYTPLHYAALFGTPEMAQILRRANAKIDAQDHSGNTPLHWSCAEMAETLIAMNANIETRNSQGSTALHLAAKLGIEEKVRTLLDANANVQAEDKLQNTPLHYAAWAGHCEIVKMVLGRGANVDSVNKLGLTPLSLAVARPCSSQLERIVSLLMSANANVHIPNCDGVTALHHAAMNQNSNIIKLLIQGGGDIHWANLKGLTVWNLAQRPGRHEIKKTISELLPEITHLQQNTLKVYTNMRTRLIFIFRSAYCAVTIPLSATFLIRRISEIMISAPRVLEIIYKSRSWITVKWTCIVRREIALNCLSMTR